MTRKLLIAAAALAGLSAGCWRDPGTMEHPTRYKEAERLFMEQKYSQAKGLFRELSESDAYAERPFNQEALYYTALCDRQIASLTRDGQTRTDYLESAIRTLNEILAAPPYASLEARALGERADISLEVGDYAGAARDYRRALRLVGDEKGAKPPVTPVDRQKLLFGLGMAEWNLRDYGESDSIFDKYLATYPQGPFVKDARQHHTKLGFGLAPSKSFYVTVGGGFAVRRQAEAMAAKLHAWRPGLLVKVIATDTAGTAVFMVRVGAFDDRKWAELQRKELETAGFGPLEVLP